MKTEDFVEKDKCCKIHLDKCQNVPPLLFSRLFGRPGNTIKVVDNFKGQYFQYIFCKALICACSKGRKYARCILAEAPTFILAVGF